MAEQLVMCECGSGRTFASCHGHYLANIDLMSPSRRSLERIANNESFQRAVAAGRRREYGCGNPMHTWMKDGKRHVRVGKRVYIHDNWMNFGDFLLSYLRLKFGRDFWSNQAAAAAHNRHPVCEGFKELELASSLSDQSSRQFLHQPSRTLNALFSLAYDLYLCEHNGSIPSELIRRLRNADEYEGALYEAFLAGLFCRSGFAIEFENERDRRRSHCEFVATNKGTAKKFSVEAKSVTTQSARYGDSALPPSIRGKLYDALSKQADFPRIIFIEVNRRIKVGDGVPEWGPHVSDAVTKAEYNMRLDDGSVPDPAYLFVTNRSLLIEPGAESFGMQVAAAGFRIDDFPPERMSGLLSMQHSRMKHLEVYQLYCALMQTNPAPHHFDDQPIAAMFRGMLEDAKDDIHHPFDAYDFVFSTYRKSPPERLREWMADHVPQVELSKMSQLQLADRYSAGIRQSIWEDALAARRRKGERL